MLIIKCCHFEQIPTKIYEIKSKNKTMKQVVFFLNKCAKCGNRTLEVITIDKDQRIKEDKRIKPKNIDSFFQKNQIIREIDEFRLISNNERPRLKLICSEYSKRVARPKY